MLTTKRRVAGERFAPAPDRRRSHILMTLAAANILLLSFTAEIGSVQAATPPPAVPLITKTTLSHSVIPASGGTTTVRINVRNAETCWFGGMTGLTISSAHQNCSNGSILATAHVTRSDSSQMTHLHIEAWAAGSGGTTATVIVYLVESGLSPVVMTTRSLKTAAVGKHYSDQLAAKGGRAPYSWRLAASELPVGLSLSPRGMLSGVPRGLCQQRPAMYFCLHSARHHRRQSDALQSHCRFRSSSPQQSFVLHGGCRCCVGGTHASLSPVSRRLTQHPAVPGWPGDGYGKRQARHIVSAGAVVPPVVPGGLCQQRPAM